MTRYQISIGARKDLNDIWDNIAADSMEAADRFTAKLQENIIALAATPGMGHRRPDLAGDRPVLFWPVGDYLILYRTQPAHIEIVAVVHGNRDIPRFMRKHRL